MNEEPAAVTQRPAATPCSSAVAGASSGQDASSYLGPPGALLGPLGVKGRLLCVAPGLPLGHPVPVSLPRSARIDGHDDRPGALRRSAAGPRAGSSRESRTSIARHRAVVRRTASREASSDTNPALEP
jgi:hypothetical protein